MDDALQRFRRQAGRELGDREGAERRYSVGLRQQAVAYWQVRETAGDGMRAVATALGIAPVSLRRWAQDARFRPVRLLEADPPARPRARGSWSSSTPRAYGSRVSTSKPRCRCSRGCDEMGRAARHRVRA